MLDSKTCRLGSNEQEFFLKNGYLYIPPVPKFERLSDVILTEISRIGKLFSQSFDIAESSEIIKANKQEYYKYVSTMGMIQLSCSDELKSVAKDMGIECPSVKSHLRVDVKEEAKHQFHWHQDAPSILGSFRMYTYWIPLTEVSPTLGSIEIIPCSHRLGIINSFSPRDEKSNKFNDNNMIIESHPILNCPSKIITSKPGSLLLLHPFTVHRSYYPDKKHKPSHCFNTHR